jgi:hypothetical protein
MQFDREKLKAVILYACSKCEPAQLGAVKLHKLLFYADMVHYAETGTPITASTYRKRPYGPTNSELLGSLREMAASGDITISTVEYFGFNKKQYSANRLPNLERLSGAETALLDEVIDFVCRNNSAKTISEFSHSRPWELVEFDEVIPYHSALHLFPNQVSLEAFEWATDQVGEIEAEKSRGASLGYEDFASFRERVLQTGSR